MSLPLPSGGMVGSPESDHDSDPNAVLVELGFKRPETPGTPMDGSEWPGSWADMASSPLASPFALAGARLEGTNLAATSRERTPGTPLEAGAHDAFEQLIKESEEEPAAEEQAGKRLETVREAENENEQAKTTEAAKASPEAAKGTDAGADNEAATGVEAQSLASLQGSLEARHELASLQERYRRLMHSAAHDQALLEKERANCATSVALLKLEKERNATRELQKRLEEMGAQLAVVSRMAEHPRPAAEEAELAKKRSKVVGMVKEGDRLGDRKGEGKRSHALKMHEAYRLWVMCVTRVLEELMFEHVLASIVLSDLDQPNPFMVTPYKGGGKGGRRGENGLV